MTARSFRTGTALALLLIGGVACHTGPSDSEIASSVDQSLSEDLSLSNSSIDVVAVGGVITLKGDVSSAAQSSRAEEIAERVAGVESVRNQLSITPLTLPAVASPPPATAPGAVADPPMDLNEAQNIETDATPLP